MCKRVPVDTYRAQRRGGRGLQGAGTREEDWVEHLFVASTHDYLMVFTRTGQCYWIKVWEIPEGGRHAKGKPIVNLLKMAPGEEVAALVPVREFSEDRYLLFCTKLGVGEEDRALRLRQHSVGGAERDQRSRRGRADRRPNHRQ